MDNNMKQPNQMSGNSAPETSGKFSQGIKSSPKTSAPKVDTDWEKAQKLFNGEKVFDANSLSSNAKRYYDHFDRAGKRLGEIKPSFYEYSKAKDDYDKKKKWYSSDKNVKNDPYRTPFTSDEIKYLDDQVAKTDKMFDDFKSNIKPRTSTHPFQEPEGAEYGWWGEDWDDVIGWDNDDLHFFQDEMDRIDGIGQDINSYYDYFELEKIRDEVESFLDGIDKNKFKISAARAQNVLDEIDDRMQEVEQPEDYDDNPYYN